MSAIARLTLSATLLLAAGCQTVGPPAPPRPATALSPAQVAMLEAQGFVPTDEGWMFDMSSRILFPTDGSGLDPERGAALQRIARALCSVDIRMARIEGHADNIGTAAHNRALSLARARAVAGALADGGMSPHLLRARGLGESQPVESNRTRQGRAENRRVAIIVPSSAEGQGPCPAR